MKVVARGLPFTVTTDRVLKFDPETATVKSELPAATLDGETAVIAGGILLASDSIAQETTRSATAIVRTIAPNRVMYLLAFLRICEYSEGSGPKRAERVRGLREVQCFRLFRGRSIFTRL